MPVRNSPADAEPPEFILSEVEAVLAGTLALMTGMIQGCCPPHREAMRCKVLANLSELERHPCVSDEFRAFTSHLQAHWHALDARGSASSVPNRQEWHSPPGTVQ